MLRRVRVALAVQELAPMFDRLFGAKNGGSISDKVTILDAVRQDAALLRKGLPKEGELRLEEHLSSIGDLERAIVSLPREYSRVVEREQDLDLKDRPRIAKRQSDLFGICAGNRTDPGYDVYADEVAGPRAFPAPPWVLSRPLSTSTLSRREAIGERHGVIS